MQRLKNLLSSYSFLAILYIILCINPAISDDLRNPAWFFVHTGKGATIIENKKLIMPVKRQIFAFTNYLYNRSHAYMSAHDFTSLWLEKKNSFYSFKAIPPWAVLSWVSGEDTFSIEFRIKTAEVDITRQHITYGIDYSGSSPYLPVENSYTLFIEASCEPSGLDQFFEKPDCDCTENCDEICRVMCWQ